MHLNLAGQSAVVVGGANGLGKAIAEGFIAEGARVAIIDRNPDTATVAKQLSSDADANGFVVDVADATAVATITGEVYRALGGCDHLVYAAAVGSGQFGFPFWNVDPAVWDRVLRINLIGAANIAHAFAPRMAEAGTGTILFIASVAGQIGSQTDPPYSASKAGLINFAQCAAKDLAPYGVRVNTLCPGMVKTSLNRSVYDAWAAQQPSSDRPSYEKWAEEKIQKVVPLGRWQTPEDVASMAVFLASPRAANVTGQTMNVDGGFVMHW